MGRRRRAQQSAARIRQMTELIEHVQCVLWEAEVELETGDWTWHMKLHPSAFCRQVFRGRIPKPREDLWTGFEIEGRLDMDRRARAAIEGGKPGYEQEFRAVREGRTYWMHENVSITKLGTDRYWLVGFVTDITAQREAEAARRQSELTVDRILAHAHCMLWRATVIEEERGLQWPHFDIPRSQLSEALFGDRVFSSELGFWDRLAMPDQAEMDERSSRAIRGGLPGYSQQFRVINPHGRLFWLNEQVAITRVADRTWSLVGVLTDITAQREAEEARQRSESRLSHLLERADTLIWQSKVERTPEGTLFWTMYIPQSQLYRRIFSADPVGARGFGWKERGVPEHEEMQRRCAEAISGGAAGYDQVFHVPGPEGTIWLSETVTIAASGPGTWDLVGIISDITARHRAEEAWQASQARLAQLLEMADCLLWEATVMRQPDDTLAWDQYIPPSALYRRIFGETTGDKRHLRWDELNLPEYPEMVERTLAAVKTCAPGYSQEFHVVQPEGDLWLREVVTMVPLSGDKFRMVGVVTDITAQRRAEMARERSELSLAALLERADCMIWQGEVRRTGPDDYAWQVFTPRSQLFRRIFGRDPEGICHFDWSESVVPEFFEMRRRSRQALARGLPGYEQVFHYRHPAAGNIWLNEKVSIKPLEPDRWELIGIITDITTQHESEAARQASEQRLHDILTHANCLLWEGIATLTQSDWDWRFHIQPSALCLKLYGTPQPRPEQGLWRSFTIPERPEMNRRCREAMHGGQSAYEQTFHIIQPDDRIVWISESVTVRALGEGRFSLVGVAVDITAQRGAEEALAAEKERLVVTLRAMSESVITTDVAGRVEFMNPAAARLTERSVEDCIGRSVQEVCALQAGRSGQAVEVPVLRVAQGDLVAELPPQTYLVTSHGNRRLVEGCCAPIHATDSRVTGTVLVVRDVTEQERLEQELVRATRLESVGVLAGGIAHDFNNILTAVMGNLSLAQLDVPAGSAIGASLHSAEKAALRARDLTQQLLTFAKGGEPVRAAVQLESIVREMTAFALHGSQVKAHYDMAPDLWPADADKGQIGRVVQNLVINAVQAMPRGGSLRIMVRNDPHDGMTQPGLAPGDYIQIAITDTGEGIKPEHVARIFDPYFTTKQTGTGLGLAAVYSIVKKHRGHIEVDSQLGQGTTFRLWLPALRERVESADSRAPWGAKSPERLNGRVLFMDDEEIIRQMATNLLRRFGLDVDCAEDGAEAVEKYRTALDDGRRYDLVIMDLTVPGGMGGLAAIGELRKIDPSVKAVVSSGYSSDPVLANHREHGFAAVVAKPYEVHEISRVLREVLAGP